MPTWKSARIRARRGVGRSRWTAPRSQGESVVTLGSRRRVRISAGPCRSIAAAGPRSRIANGAVSPKWARSRSLPREDAVPGTLSVVGFSLPSTPAPSAPSATRSTATTPSTRRGWRSNAGGRGGSGRADSCRPLLVSLGTDRSLATGAAVGKRTLAEDPVKDEHVYMRWRASLLRRGDEKGAAHIRDRRRRGRPRRDRWRQLPASADRKAAGRRKRPDHAVRAAEGRQRAGRSDERGAGLEHRRVRAGEAAEAGAPVRQARQHRHPRAAHLLGREAGGEDHPGRAQQPVRRQSLAKGSRARPSTSRARRRSRSARR